MKKTSPLLSRRKMTEGLYFDTCFPGWYRGRTIHIHYGVMLASKQLVVFNA